MNKFIICNDKNSADKISKNGIKLITSKKMGDNTVWIFEYESEFSNLPGCYPTNKLFF